MGGDSKAIAPLVIENSGRWLGNDGTWSTFYVHVGSSPQQFHVLPSINAQTVYVPINQDCERLNISDCGASRGVEVFASHPSPGFTPNSSTTWDEIGIYGMNLGSNYDIEGNAIFGYDSVGPSASENVNTPTIKKQVVAAYASSNFWVGSIGLSPSALSLSDTDKPHSFLSRLKEEGHVPSLSYGLQIGAPYRFTKVAGDLVLGGYNRARHSNNILTVADSGSTAVGLQSVSAKFKNGTTTTLLDSGVLTVLDTDVSELWLPPAICDRFASAFGLTYHNESERYVVFDATHAKLQADSPVFSFKVGTSVSDGETITIDVPYAAFDLQAKYPIFSASTNYFPLRRANNESTYALGRAFLQEAYLSMDLEHGVFNISQAVFSSPPPKSDIVPIQTKEEAQSSSSSKTLSSGAIAGIAVGSAVIVMIIIALVWYLCRRRKSRADQRSTGELMHSSEQKDYHGNYSPDAMSKLMTQQSNFELEGSNVGDRVNLELEGRNVERPGMSERYPSELYAPPEQGKYAQNLGTRNEAMEPVEMAGTPLIFEMPSSHVDEGRQGYFPPAHAS